MEQIDRLLEKELPEVHVTVDAPLPNLIKRQVSSQAVKWASRKWWSLGPVRLDIHIKKEGRLLGCFAHLFIQGTLYRAAGQGSDIRRTISAVLDSLERQARTDTVKNVSLLA
ncbi:hypothetical protein GOV11_01160 [Candidatus Woesearchaeota archaeon]|nr:hypothetical protein [Candidatus Woesearchaeota archaeon]